MLVADWEKPWDSPHQVVPWAITWDYGPDNWVVTVSHNDVIPAELAYAEPVTEKVLGLYPA